MDRPGTPTIRTLAQTLLLLCALILAAGGAVRTAIGTASHSVSAGHAASADHSAGHGASADHLGFPALAHVAPPPVFTTQSVLGGTSHAVAYAAPHVFLGVGPRVVVLDAADPAAPVELGATPILSGIVIALAADGDQVYAGIAVGGPAGYVLCAIDASVPASPMVRGCTPLAGSPRRIVVQGGVAFVAAHPIGLDIIDVSNPDAPTRLSTFATDEPTFDVDVDGGRAYVAVEHVVYLIGGVPNTLAGVRMVDVSDPAVPVDAGVFNQSIPDSLRIVSRLRVRGDRGYALGNDRISVYDMSDPDDALLLGQRIVAVSPAPTLVLGDDELWLVDPPEGAGASATRIDVSSPITPTIAGRVDSPAPDMAWSGVAIDDRLIAATRSGGYDLIDLSVPASPVVTTPYATLGNVAEVVLRGDHLVAAVHQRGLAVVDITDPGAPRKLVVTGEADRYAIAVAVHGSHAYLLSSSMPGSPSRLDVYDLTTPATPVLVTTLEPAANARAVAVHAGRLFVVGDDFEVYDLGDPASPSRLDGIPLADRAQTVAFAGDYSYVGGASPWIVPIDLSDPARPVEMARVVAQGNVAGLAAGGGTLYAALGARGLATYALTDPGAPVRGVEAADISGARDVAFGGGRPWVVKPRQIVAPDPDALADKFRRPSLDLPLDVWTLDVTDEPENLIVAAGEGIVLVRSVPGVEPTPTDTSTPSPTPTDTPTPPISTTPVDPTPVDQTPTSTPDGSSTTPPPTPVLPSETPTPENSTPGTPTLTPTPEATGEDIIRSIHLPWTSR